MDLFHKVRYFLLKKRDPIRYAREIGVTIGKNCRLIGSPNWGKRTVADYNRKSHRSIMRLCTCYA